MSLRASLFFCASLAAVAVACSANAPGSGALQDSGGSSGNNPSGGSGNGSGAANAPNGGTGNVHVNPPMPGQSCGNNQHEDGEECDDGNKEGKDGCTAGCQ